MTGPMARRAHNVRLPTRSQAAPFMDRLMLKNNQFKRSQAVGDCAISETVFGAALGLPSISTARL